METPDPTSLLSPSDKPLKPALKKPNLPPLRPPAAVHPDISSKVAPAPGGLPGQPWRRPGQKPQVSKHRELHADRFSRTGAARVMMWEAWEAKTCRAATKSLRFWNRSPAEGGGGGVGGVHGGGSASNAQFSQPSLRTLIRDTHTQNTSFLLIIYVFEPHSTTSLPQPGLHPLISANYY